MENYYEQSRHWDRELTPQELERLELLKGLLPPDVETVLDAGCGSGSIGNYLDSKRFRVTGIDRSREALKHFSRTKLAADVSFLPFADNSFDLVICSDVLEHLGDEAFQRTVSELQRVSRKYILVISPNDEDLEANQARCSECGTAFHINWHVRSLSMRKLAQVFKDSFGPLAYSYFGDLWNNEPREKYLCKRSFGAGYLTWDLAVCPLCGTRQETRTDIEEEVKRKVDLDFNWLNDGYSNRMTELAALFVKAGLKKNYFDFSRYSDDKLYLLSNSAGAEAVRYGRAYIDTENNVFTRGSTLHYPFSSYLLVNEKQDWGAQANDGGKACRCYEDAKGADNHALFFMPGVRSERKLAIEYRDISNTSPVLINVYSLASGYVNIGRIEFNGTEKAMSKVFDIPLDLVPANEGYIFELATEGAGHPKASVPVYRVYLQGAPKPAKIDFSRSGEASFLSRDYMEYQADRDAFRGLDLRKEFLDLREKDYIYDPSYKCFYYNFRNSIDSNLVVAGLSRDQTSHGQFDRLSVSGPVSSEGANALSGLVETLRADLYAKLSEIEARNRSRHEGVRNEISGIFKESIEMIARGMVGNIRSEMMDKITATEKAQDSRTTEFAGRAQKVDALEKELNSRISEITGISEKISEMERALNSRTKDIPEEFDKLSREIDAAHRDIYTISNSVDRLSSEVAKIKGAIRNPLGFLAKKLNGKIRPKIEASQPAIAPARKDGRKHLVILTPDVKIDRRTVQMCGTLISDYNIRCTIIAALEDRDDYGIEHLVVRRVDPYKTPAMEDWEGLWRPERYVNCEDFYWLHSRYLYMAMQEDADYFMGCDLPVMPAGVIAAKTRGVPFIYDAHELYPEQACFPQEKRESYSHVEDVFIRHAGLVITVNESIAEEMAKRYRIKKPEVILNAINPSPSFSFNRRYDHFRSRLQVGSSKIVLFQGGFSPDRNLENLVESAKYLEGLDAVIVMMGFGDYGEDLKRIAEKAGVLGSKVLFFPAVSQEVLLEYSASADIGVIPYPHVDLNSYFCTPNKLFEFIQAGLPILANDSPELNRFVKENGVGFTLKMDTAEEIASGIREMLGQDLGGYRARLAVVREELSWDVEARKFSGFFGDFTGAGLAKESGVSEMSISRPS